MFEPGYQKLSIGLGKTKVSDQIVDVFLVREVWPSLLNAFVKTKSGSAISSSLSDLLLSPEDG